MEPDPLLSDPRFVSLLAENAALRAEIVGLREVLEVLKASAERTEKLLVSLQERLGKDSRNSSKPPSSDGPSASPRPPSAPTGRKRGGQPGRKGSARMMLPEGSENRVVPVPLACCPHCSTAIPPDRITGSTMHRVVDLAQKLTEVIGYALEQGTCPHCRKQVQAPLPPEAAPGGIGPRLQAAAAYLRTEGRMSLTPLQRYFSEVMGVAVSRGWLHESGVALSRKLEPAWENLAEQIRGAEVLNLDETGFGRKDRDWIWAALSARTVLFHFSGTRGAKALTTILPEGFSGVIGTDRYGAYNALKSAVRQFCWAHLRREFIALSESRHPEVAVLGTRLVAEQEEVFALWHAFRNGEITRKDLRAFTAINLARLKRGLLQASAMDHKAARNLGKDLLKNWDRLWVFLKVEGVEPTNNRAERALRPLVILKRIFQRLPSPDGKRFFERLLSLGATARIRGVAYFDWLLKAVRAARLNQPLPALEPA
jgi:transposase